MARSASVTSPSLLPPSREGTFDSKFSTRILPDPNTSDPASRKRLKSHQPAGQAHAASPLARPPQHHQRPAVESGPSRYTDPHALGQGAAGLPEAPPPDRMSGLQAGESSDRRDWAQPSRGKEPSRGSDASGDRPLLSHHAPGEKTSKRDDQNVTSLTGEEGGERGQKRRLSESETPVGQERLLHIVEDLDKLEKEQKDFGKRQLKAIKEGAV
ncbi:hypothetical protein J3F83DRAFT_743108 [Trichoderma novae-zelandiae]